MSGIRVHKLAVELNITSKDLIEELKKQGIEVKNHMSSVDEETALIVKELFAKEKDKGKKKVPVPEAKKIDDIDIKIVVDPGIIIDEKDLEKEKEEIIEEIIKETVVEDEYTKYAEEIEIDDIDIKKGKKLKDTPEEIEKKRLLEKHPSNKEEPEALTVPEEKKVFAGTGKKPLKIKIAESITVKDLAAKIGCMSSDIIKELMKLGIMATINQGIDIEAASKLSNIFNVEVEADSVQAEDFSIEEEKDKEGELIPRSPVVTIMGHVDHGKTSLLDAIRKTNITEKEAGGITQHIGAYKVDIEKGSIVFLDTPGHEAFTAMRARGVKVTDIVVLVVAADDGVMPQTIEAINHAEAANVPIIVAINKIDKAEARPDIIKQKLSDYKLLPEEWGGSTIFVEVSAKKGIGIESLLEMILLQAEMLELKANPHVMPRGIIIESKLDKGKGPVGTVLLQKGTLKVGQVFVVGVHYGKIRALINDKGKKVKEVMPSTPVEISGFSSVPNAGDEIIIVDDERKARQISELRAKKHKTDSLTNKRMVTLDDLFEHIKKGEIKELNIIIKADVQGSLQALSDSLTKLSTKDVYVKIIHGATGTIVDTDIMLAAASNAIIIGFNVRPSEKTADLARKENVDIRLYTIIYKTISDIKSAMEGLLDPTFKEKVLGRAEVREIFTIPKIGTIAGCYVLNGSIKKNINTRLIRDNVVVYEGKIGSLRRFKEDVKEVAGGFECGIGIEKFSDLKLGDIIEPFEFVEVARTL